MLQSNAVHRMPYRSYLYHIMIFALIFCHEMIPISRMNNLSQYWIHFTSFVLFSRVILLSYKRDVKGYHVPFARNITDYPFHTSSFTDNCFARNIWMPQHMDVTHYDALFFGVKIPKYPMEVFQLELLLKHSKTVSVPIYIQSSPIHYFLLTP